MQVEVEDNSEFTYLGAMRDAGGGRMEVEEVSEFTHQGAVVLHMQYIRITHDGSRKGCILLGI